MVDVKLFGDCANLLELYTVEPVREHWNVNVNGCVVPPVGIPPVNDMYTAVVGGELVCGMVKHTYTMLAAVLSQAPVPRSTCAVCLLLADGVCGMMVGMDTMNVSARVAQVNNVPAASRVSMERAAYGDVAAHGGGVFHCYTMRCPDEGDAYDGERVCVDVTRGTGYHTGMTRSLSATAYYDADRDTPHGQRLSASVNDLGTHYGVRMEVVAPAHVAALLASTYHVTPTGSMGIASALDSGNALLTAFEDAMERTYVPTLVSEASWLNSRNHAVVSALSMLGQFDAVSPRNVLAQWRERVEAAVASAGVDGVPLAPVVESVLGVLAPYRWFTYTVIVEGYAETVWGAAESDENGYGELWAVHRLIAEAWSARPSDEI